jgi:transposase
MEVLHERCAGLDVHKDTIVACVRIACGREVSQEVKTFGTTTKELLALSGWLEEKRCTHVAMEATGVYWRPVWHILEPDFQLVLANAAHIRNVPGRKTDVNDSMWIADLLAHGLIRASFVPPVAIQELRSLTRTRKQLTRERAQHVLRIQKTLEDANVKVASFISDITGKSGRAILTNLIGGATDPQVLLAGTSKRLKATPDELREALKGHVSKNHRFLLKLHFDQVKAIEDLIERVDEQIGGCLAPFRAKLKLLVSMPGVGEVVAQVILSEVGADMARFPDAGNLRSWAGFCPRNDETAGKRRSSRIRPGAPWLKTVLVQAAWSAVRTKNSYLRALFFRLKARRGPGKAIVAAAASMLTSAYHMLKNDVPYKDLGPTYFEQTDKKRTIRRLTARLHQLGCEVTIREAPATVSF